MCGFVSSGRTKSWRQNTAHFLFASAGEYPFGDFWPSSRREIITKGISLVNSLGKCFLFRQMFFLAGGRTKSQPGTGHKPTHQIRVPLGGNLRIFLMTAKPRCEFALERLHWEIQIRKEIQIKDSLAWYTMVTLKHN